MLAVMCGRSTYKLTWEEIVRLYRLTSDQPPQNTRARYNVCPTTTIDTIVGQDGNRRLVPMRWGLVPSWWSKSLKDLKLATFNARAETVATKPFFRGPFKRTRCLIPISGYYEWQDGPGGKQPWYFTVRAVLGNAKTISMALEMFSGHIGNPPKWPPGQPFKYDLPSIGARVQGGIPIRGQLSAWLVPDPITGVWQCDLASICPSDH
jgi:hypothetical protein